MELKLNIKRTDSTASNLLIVPYGIETDQNWTTRL